MNELYNFEYDISIIVPCLDEEDNINPLYDRLKNVLESNNLTFEIIFIDDGSSDETYDAITRLNQHDERVKGIRFRKNFGQTSAIAAGFDYACGKVIIAIDGDLQYDPEDIPKLLEKIEDGYDIASGWRENRNDSFFTRRLPSMAANKLMSIISGIKLHDFGSTFKAYKSEIAKEIRLYGEMHRFVPALASGLGARIAEVSVNLKPRCHGKSKYGISRTWRVMLDIIAVKFLICYFKQPLRLFGLIGLILGSLGLFIIFFLGLSKFLLGAVLLNHAPLLLLASLLLLIGVQFTSLGLIAEMISRTYHESQGKPIYNVKQILGKLQNGYSRVLINKEEN